MFESAELHHSISKSRFDREEPKLRAALLEAQFEVLDAARFPVLLVVNGVEAAGKGEVMNLLHAWMDPHHIRVHALEDPTSEVRERPPLWPFWRNLPPKGETGIFLGGWYAPLIDGRVAGDLHRGELGERLERIEKFERMLVQDGALIVKVWLHLSKKAQRKRLKSLERDPLTAWRVTPDSWTQNQHYGRIRKVSEEILRRSSSAEASWVVVDCEDERYRDYTLCTELLNAMRARLDAKPVRTAKASRTPRTSSTDGKNAITAIDLSARIDRDDYEKQLEKYQGRLNRLVRSKRFRERSLVLAFEGMDAAGKGGAIQRVIGALDARWYRVVPIAAPTEEERARQHLWRFWRHMPRWRHVALFDRSWYGRVLVERVEGFCDPEAWMRAYAEINEFEAELAEHGTVICKFWLQISEDVQLQRFRERERTKYKNYKITPDDWRNRKKWGDYVAAAAEMVDRTSTELAPWTLVAANDKHHSRVVVLKTIVKRLEQALGEQ